MAPHKDYDTSSPRSYTPPSFNSQTISTRHLLPESIYTNSSENTSVDTMDSAQPQLVDGVYCPIITPFKPETEDIDVPALEKHVLRLAKAGITGLAAQGSNGEAVSLTHDERSLVTSTVRKVLDEAGFKSMPLIVGCGAQSTRETLQLCREAYENGGSHALVLPPSYYQPLFKPAAGTPIEFFTEVADKSPIPIMIYNYPGACSGLDLNSDVISKLSQHDNIVGVKLTCANTGKLNRIVKNTKPKSDSSTITSSKFLVLGGSGDFALQSLVGGGNGMLAGVANIAPRACVKLFQLGYAKKYEEAQEIQHVVAQGDWQVIQNGVVGTKTVLETYFGYGGFARSPLPKPTKELTLRLQQNIKELMDLEEKLEKEATQLPN